MRNAFNQDALIDLIGNFINNDAGAAAVVELFIVSLGTHQHAAASGAIPFNHAFETKDCAPGGKVRRRDKFDQVINRGIGVIEQMHAGIDGFPKIMRRNIGGHTHSNTGTAVNQKMRQARGQNRRFFFRVVVIGDEINRVFADIGEHFTG